MNIAVILAAGQGKRIGDNIPKQFIKVQGKTILEYTLTTYDNHQLIDEIAVVCNENYVDKVEQIVANSTFKKVRSIIIGGKERYHSTLSAINHYKYLTNDDNILFHDAVRPLIQEKNIKGLINELRYYKAVTVAIPLSDTLVSIDAGQKTIKNIQNRSLFHRVQTPQGFKYGIIKEAFKMATDLSHFTDDCSIVSHYCPKEKIAIVKGDSLNFKITYKEDLFLFEKILECR